MKIDANRLKKALPLIKDYAENRGKHLDQKFASGLDIYRGNAVSALIRDDKLVRNSYSTSYCYASLMSKERLNDIVLLQVQPHYEDQNEEAYRHYIDWVVNYSPWRHAFISKNINRIIRDGVVVAHRGDLPKQYLRTACIALRMAWENYSTNRKYLEVDIWWDLLQKVGPNLAYVAGKSMVTRKYSDSSLIVKKGHDTGHTPLEYSNNSYNLHINGWLKENMLKSGEWKSDSTIPSVTKRIDNIINNIGKTDVVVNPFAPHHRASEIKREAFIEAMHSELPKLEAEIYA